MTYPTNPADPGHRHATFDQLQPRPANSDPAIERQVQELAERIAHLEAWRDGVADAATAWPEAAVRFAVGVAVVTRPAEPAG
jgi:hypothetical protein